jgi:hypothetical protein
MVLFRLLRCINIRLTMVIFHVGRMSKKYLF